MEKKFERREETYAIIGAAMEVHKVLGGGFKEKVYQDALNVELQLRNIPSIKEFHIPIVYKDILLSHDYFADFLCYDDIIVEVKSVPELLKEHENQLLTYMRLYTGNVGLLINFGSTALVWKRMVL